MIAANIVPRPLRLEELGGSFRLAPTSRIRCSGLDAQPVAVLLAEYLRLPTGYALPVVASYAAEDGDIVLRQTGSPVPDEAGFLPEAYRCHATPQRIELIAESGAGLARGIQTLRQLLPTAIFANRVQEAEWSIPCVRIEDSPRFRWRGLHLDISRHFFSAVEICRFIELLALHRLNVCHLHLTDDQGWRLEIRKYPKLAEVGSVRRQTLITHERDRPRRYDGQRYTGTLTQQDAADIVAFAARRHVTVVPEIEMPGHAQAAIAAYPELGNTGAPIDVRCHWGISQHVYNVEESTIAFMCDVLDEVTAIFPSRFIHVGGDEAPKRQWSESARAQERMAELGLRSEDQLQSWFVGRIGKHLASRGRRLIGWDEILEGGLAEGATVMSWRGEEGGIAAAKAGHDVVMAPNQWVYFDHYQAHPIQEEPRAIGGMTPTDRVYAYEPVPASLSPELARHVLGAQGQLWTEYIPDVPHLDYMTYPRACALAETLWLPAEEKRYSDFLIRLATHRQRLAYQGVAAHPRP